MDPSLPDDPPPRRPPDPEPDACCGEGCVHCVLDRHAQALEAYHEALRAWRLRHPDAALP